MPVDTVTHRRPDLFDETTHSLLSDYIVIVFDNEYNTWEEVIGILQKATGCSLDAAEAITYEAHLTGRAIAYNGTQEECERVAGILRQIRLQVETDRG